MSEPIFFYTAIYTTTLMLTGLLLTMWRFFRLSRRERLKVGKADRTDRLRTDADFGYVPGYSGA